MCIFSIIKAFITIIFGFIGVYIVLDPNFSNFEYRNLVPVLSAFFYAASMTITKYTSDKDDVNTQLFYFYLIPLNLDQHLNYALYHHTPHMLQKGY